MANPKHLAVISRGVDVFNRWRQNNPSTNPDLGEADLFETDLRRANLYAANLREAGLHGVDLSEANLKEADLRGAHLVRANLGKAIMAKANLSRANLREASLRRANLRKADLSDADLLLADLNQADLSEAKLYQADLVWADLSGTNLRKANLSLAHLIQADLSGAKLNGANLSAANLAAVNLTAADLSGADLHLASLTDANLKNAIVRDCRIYGISAWNVNLVGAQQGNLVITPRKEPTITVDNLQIAQFIYLLLNKKEIRAVIDTITSKVVLILGRFTPERKAVLDSLRDELRKRNYLPVLFDFDKPASRNLTETVSTLAHMARFVIADITDVRSIPQELMAIVPHLPSVPVQPLLLASDKEYGMFLDFRAYPWVLEPFVYDDQEMLLASFNEKVITPAEEKVQKHALSPKRNTARSSDR
jgi:uncharacterized protein YjbI with pentapeptide repeats